MKHGEQREFSSKEGQEPLRGEHVSLQAQLLEMLEQLRHLILQQEQQKLI